MGEAERARPASRGGIPAKVPALPGHEAPVLSLVQAEVVVEAVQVKFLQVFAQLHGLPEIEGGALHGGHLP